MIPDHLLHNTDVYANRHILLNSIKHLIPVHAVVAEIGVAYGGFTQVILDTLKPGEFDAFDTFDLHEQPIVFGSDPKLVLGNQTHWEYYRGRFPDIPTWNGKSWEQLALVAPNIYDFVYVDGDHSYDGVKADIEQLKRAVKPGGVIMFDDYTNFDTIAWEKFGVMAAVNEYIAEGHEVLGISLQDEGFHNIAVRA